MTITTRLRRFAITAAVLYAVVLVLIAFWPIPVDRPAAGFLRRLVGWLGRQGLPFITYDAIEAGANVLLFVPAGLLLVVLLGAGWWWLSILAGTAASVFFELGQKYLLDERFATVDDVYANAIGTAVGTLIGVITLVIAGRVDVIRRRRAQAAQRVHRQPSDRL